MKKNPYKEAPANFSVCVHTDCTCGSTCLRQLAYPVLLEREAFLHLANPTRCTKDHSCPYYRDAAPVTYMRGFTQMKKRMYPEQYQKFMNFLIARFGRNPYFEKKKRRQKAEPPRTRNHSQGPETGRSHRKSRLRFKGRGIQLVRLASTF